MKKSTCKQAKEIPLVEFLQTLRYWPVKIQNENVWYRSPLREEKTASFKVNTKLNVWYDHGLGKGGDIINSIKQPLLRPFTFFSPAEFGSW
jgi:DNA primase